MIRIGEQNIKNKIKIKFVSKARPKCMNHVKLCRDSVLSQIVFENKNALFSSISQRKQWQEENQIGNLDLNLDLRKSQKNKIEEFLLANENSLRRTLNLPIFSNYKEFMEREDDPEILDIDHEVLSEAANILLDLVELKNKPLFSTYSAS